MRTFDEASSARGAMHEVTGVAIRAVADTDLPSIIAILNREIAESPYVYAEAPVTIDERRTWLEMHRKAELPVYVAVDGTDHERVVGWAALSPYRSSSGYRFTAEISVYVDPSAQRRGIATRLLSELDQIARARGLHALVASVDADNVSSIALLARLGFVEGARLSEVGRKFGRWRTQLLLLKSLA